jgi:hypothetical protein
MGYWAARLADWCSTFRDSVVVPSSRIVVQTPSDDEISPKTGKVISTDTKAYKLAQIQWLFLLFLPRTTQYDEQC